mgnify:FL=1
MKVGDLVWYYPAYGSNRVLCIISREHDIHGLLYNLYDIKSGLEFITSKSCIKKLDKIKSIG